MKDPWGANLVFRGFELNHGLESSTHIDEVAKTGANYVRILPWADNGGPNPNSNEQIEARIRDAIRNHMMISIGWVGIPGGTNNARTQWAVDWFINNKSWLMKYEQHLIIHAIGEQDNGIDATTWRNNAIGWVNQLRAAGYKAPIDVLSVDGGRNINMVLNNGQQVIDADPEHNLIFGWQAYWPWNLALTDNWWMYSANGYSSMSAAIDAVASKSFPIQIGNGVWDQYSGDQHYIDYKTIMTKAQQHQIGWAIWNWSGEYGTPMTNNWQGLYGDWYSVPNHPFGSDTGYQVSVGHAASVQNTSVRTAFQNTLGGGTGLKGEYFDNANFTNLITTRTEEVNFNWGSGSPSGSIAADTFSVRWTGEVQAPVTGTYTFETTTDDNVTLWVNGVQVLTGATGTHSGTISLTAGQKYSIRIDYFENTGQAYAHLRWQVPGTTQRVIIPSVYLFPNSQSSGGGLVNGAVYEIEPANAPGMRLDVSGIGTANGTPVFIWGDLNGANQRFRIEQQSPGVYELIPQHATTKRLDTAGAGTWDGCPMQIWDDANVPQQRFQLQDQGGGLYEIVPQHATNKRVQVRNNGTTNGTEVEIWPDTNASNQRWRFLQQ